MTIETASSFLDCITGLLGVDTKESVRSRYVYIDMVWYDFNWYDMISYHITSCDMIRYCMTLYHLSLTIKPPNAMHENVAIFIISLGGRTINGLDCGWQECHSCSASPIVSNARQGSLDMKSYWMVWYEIIQPFDEAMIILIGGEKGGTGKTTICLLYTSDAADE